MTEIKTVIFDLDGTLVDSAPAIASAVNTALVKLGCPTHPVASYEGFIGNGVRKTLERALPAGSAERLVDQCLEYYLMSYAEVWPTETRIYPEIPEVLAQLKASGFNLAILTNKRHENALQHARLLFPEFDPELVFGERDLVPIKPDPESALQICRKLKCKPEECMMVGDMEADILTACSANMVGVLAAWGYGKDIPAERTAHTPSDIIQLAKGTKIHF